MPIEVEELLVEISAESPCGPNCEYEAAFTELERIAQGRAEQQIGDSVVAAEPPNWREVASKATALFATTKDLRVALHLTKALLDTAGLEGLVDGLAVLRGLLERYWDGVHPELDPDDDNDPTMRINILAALNDADGLLSRLRTVPLVNVRGLGAYSLRDVLISTHELEVAEGEETPDASSIDAAFFAVELEELEKTGALARTASEHVTAMEAAFNQRLGAGYGPDLTGLRGMLDRCAKIVTQRLAARGAGDATDEADGTDADGAGGGGGGGAGQQAPLSGQVNTREQVVQALDKVCAYFERHEPSSPVPLLLRRAKNLVHKDFFEIIKDLAPSGIEQVENIRGFKEESDG